jgi:hypothetical protein
MTLEFTCTGTKNDSVTESMVYILILLHRFLNFYLSYRHEDNLLSNHNLHDLKCSLVNFTLVDLIIILLTARTNSFHAHHLSVEMLCWLHCFNFDIIKCSKFQWWNISDPIKPLLQQRNGAVLLWQWEHGRPYAQPNLTYMYIPSQIWIQFISNPSLTIRPHKLSLLFHMLCLCYSNSVTFPYFSMGLSDYKFCFLDCLP